MDSVSAASKRVYEPLPPNIQETVVPLFHNNEPFVKTFLSSVLPEADHHGIDDTLRKSFPLACLGRRQRKTKSRRGKGSLSLTERRRLGLYQLNRHGSKFIDALPLHELWLQYISSLISLPDIEKNGFTAKPSDKQWSQVTLALYRADYHGAELEVTRSKCSSLRGIKGIVLMDTKNTFKMIGRDNIIRTVPKSPCVFSLNFEGYTCTIFGKYFCTRPAERSVKKVKGHCPSDL
ncbi:Ribonuclease P protein subunit p29 [Frankliniella fusca]|uniref:Ribonuclease P protein subunit p29 n=1 Tax=Frankliniella fusca TaxID=407009 RepID=A0AAE1LBY9_9NEOP|nr:Ribonuclease P protein subunit p29 [Frankliniella fusca]